MQGGDHTAGEAHDGAFVREPDEGLIEAIAGGDADAFRSLLARYLDSIHAYLYRMTGSRTDAEDLAQETFLRVWRRASTFEPGQVRVTTWLHTIAHNLCIDSIRRNRLMGDADVADRSDEGASDPLHLAAAAELAARLERAITALPDNQRSALLLCQVQGFSNAQAAEILGVKVRALESLLARARRSLRGTFRGAEDGSGGTPRGWVESE